MVQFQIFVNIRKISTFWPKLKSLIETRKFGRNSKVWSKLESLVETRKFGRNIEILEQNKFFQVWTKFWSKLESLIEARNFGRNIEILEQNNFFQVWTKVWSKKMRKISLMTFIINFHFLCWGRVLFVPQDWHICPMDINWTLIFSKYYFEYFVTDCHYSWQRIQIYKNVRK